MITSAFFKEFLWLLCGEWTREKARLETEMVRGCCSSTGRCWRARRGAGTAARCFWWVQSTELADGVSVEIGEVRIQE